MHPSLPPPSLLCALQQQRGCKGRVRRWWWGARGAAHLLLTSLCPCPSDISPGFGFLMFLFIRFISCTRALWLLFFSVHDSSVCFSASICSSHRCLLILPGIKPHYTPCHSSSASLMRMLNGTSPDTYIFAIVLKKPSPVCCIVTYNSVYGLSANFKMRVFLPSLIYINLSEGNFISMTRVLLQSKSGCF